MRRLAAQLSLLSLLGLPAKLGLLVCGTALVVTACGPTTPDPVSAPVPDRDLALQDWELRFDDGEMTTFREGRILLPQGYGPDARRIPAQGVTVELWAPTPSGDGLERKLAQTVTDGDGRFRVGPGHDVRWALKFSRPGRASMVAGSGLFLPGSLGLPAAGPVEAGLRLGRDLRGRVVDPAGQGVPGASVEAFTMAYSESTVTGPDGGFEIRPPRGELILVVGGDARSRTSVQIPEEGPVPDAEIRVEPATPLTGRVVCVADGAPVAGAVVLLSSDQTRWVRTDDSGRFEIESPRRGRVAAFAKGWGWRSTSVPVAGEVEIRLSPASTVRGRVLDPQGAAVAGARLLAVVPRYDRGTDRVLGPVSAADGRFSFEWVPPSPRGSARLPRVLAVRRGAGVSGARAVDGDLAGVELRLGGESTVAGTVSRADGAPLEGAGARAFWNVAGFDDADFAVLGMPSERAAQTGKDGRFKLYGVLGGTAARVEVAHEGWSASLAADGQLTFTVPRGKTISGRLVPRADVPVPPGGRVTATLISRADFEVRRSVDVLQDATFEITDLPAGTYQLVGTVKGFELAGAVVQPGAGEVVLDLERRGQITVLVNVPGGTPATERPGEVWFRLHNKHRSRRIRAEASGGRFQAVMRLVWAGSYRLEADGGVWRGEMDPLELTDGEFKTVTMVLERTLALTATLQEPDGTSLGAGIQAVVRPLGIVGARPQVALTNEAGQIRVSGLETGSWMLQVSSYGRPPLRHRVEVGPDGAELGPLSLPPYGSVDLTVVGEDGKPVGGAVLAVSTTTGEPVYAWVEGGRSLVSRVRADDAGKARLLGVVAGEVRIKVTGAGGDLGSRTVMIEAGGRTTVRVP